MTVEAITSSLTKFQAGFIEKDLQSALINIGADVEIMHREILMGPSFANNTSNEGASSAAAASVSDQIEINQLKETIRASERLILEKDARIVELLKLLNGP